MKSLRKIAKGVLNSMGVELRAIRPSGGSQYSYQAEEAIIKRLLGTLDQVTQVYVDIGAAGGVNGSNSFALVNAGWSGLAIELGGDEFSKLAYEYRNHSRINLARTKVTPDNVLPLLASNGIPKNFGFLTLDIDGYDYFVLENVLTEYRPSLICAEINEKVPPPVKFTVTYDPNYAGPQGHLYGQSLAQLNVLCEKHDYAIVELEYNNAFLVPRELNKLPEFTPEEAYHKGYLDRPDRLSKYPWNSDMEAIHNLSPQQAVEFIQNKFSGYSASYLCQP